MPAFSIYNFINLKTFLMCLFSHYTRSMKKKNLKKFYILKNLEI